MKIPGETDKPGGPNASLQFSKLIGDILNCEMDRFFFVEISRNHSSCWFRIFQSSYVHLQYFDFKIPDGFSIFKYKQHHLFLIAVVLLALSLVMKCKINCVLFMLRMFP